MKNPEKKKNTAINSRNSKGDGYSWNFIAGLASSSQSSMVLANVLLDDTPENLKENLKRK